MTPKEEALRIAMDALQWYYDEDLLAVEQESLESVDLRPAKAALQRIRFPGKGGQYVIPFTDTELRKMKEELAANGEIYDCVLPALVRRLEAAERVALMQYSDPNYMEAVDEWQKRKGY